MTDSVIQKIYDLDQRDLSLLICECVFGKIEKFSNDKETRTILDYKKEVVPNATIIVKTYDIQKNVVGTALVVKTQYKIPKDRADVTFINLAIIAQPNQYVDLRSFSLGDTFSSQRDGLKVYYLRKISELYLQLFSENYGNIGFEPESSARDGFNLDFNLNTQMSTWALGNSFTQIYSGEAPLLSLAYVKSDQPGDHPSAMMIETLSDRDINMNFTNLTITFIPVEKAAALLAK